MVKQVPPWLVTVPALVNVTSTRNRSLPFDHIVFIHQQESQTWDVRAARGDLLNPVTSQHEESLSAHPHASFNRAFTLSLSAVLKLVIRPSMFSETRRLWSVARYTEYTT